MAGGTLSFTGAGSVPSTPGDLIISNGAALAVRCFLRHTVAGQQRGGRNQFDAEPYADGTANGLNAAGSLTLQDNATINLNYGSVTANPTAPAINVGRLRFRPGHQHHHHHQRDWAEGRAPFR